MASGRMTLVRSTASLRLSWRSSSWTAAGRAGQVEDGVDALGLLVDLERQPATAPDVDLVDGATRLLHDIEERVETRGDGALLEIGVEDHHDLVMTHDDTHLLWTWRPRSLRGRRVKRHVAPAERPEGRRQRGASAGRARAPKHVRATTVMGAAATPAVTRMPDPAGRAAGSEPALAWSTSGPIRRYAGPRDPAAGRGALRRRSLAVRRLGAAITAPQSGGRVREDLGAEDAGRGSPCEPFEALSLDQLRARTSIKWRMHGPDVLPLWVAEMDAHAARRASSSAVAAALHAGDTRLPLARRRVRRVLRRLARRHWGWTSTSAATLGGGRRAHRRHATSLARR